MKLSACNPLAPNQLSELWHQLAMAATTPERWELSEHGEIIWLPPVTNKHQLTIAWLQEELHAQLGGLAVHRLALCTSIGVRAPDVAWLPTRNFDGMSLDGALLESPPILAEVLSEEDNEVHVTRRVAAYLQAGAVEVIVVQPDGELEYFRSDGPHDTSAFELKLAAQVTREGHLNAQSHMRPRRCRYHG
jgi:Uma2 family endonuclease